ncbi:MAG: CPBP family intramembrane metalloprotease [Pseudoxanthomonas sp.]
MTSEPGSARVLAADAAPPPTLPPPPLRLRSVLGNFVLDLAIFVVAMLLMSLVVGIVWAVVRAVEVAVQGGFDAENPDVLMNAIGAPAGAAMLWMTLLSTGTAAALLYFWRRRAGPAERAASFAAIRRPATWGWIALTVLAVLVLSNGLTALGRLAGFAPEPANQAPIEQALTSSPGFVTLFVVLLAPLYEELLFRRVLFGRLWAAGRPWLGMALSGAAFACMHEFPGFGAGGWQATTLLWCTYALMGVAFAWVYRRTGTLWAPIAAHALNNAAAMLALKLGAGG